MSVYRTLTVEASFDQNELTKEVSLVPNIITAEADLTTTVRHNTVSDYELLIHKPQINSVELIGNKSLPEIGVDTLTNLELEAILQ